MCCIALLEIGDCIFLIIVLFGDFKKYFSLSSISFFMEVLFFAGDCYIFRNVDCAYIINVVQFIIRVIIIMEQLEKNCYSSAILWSILCFNFTTPFGHPVSVVSESILNLLSRLTFIGFKQSLRVVRSSKASQPVLPKSTPLLSNWFVEVR